MTDTTDIAGSSARNKQQIVDAVTASSEWALLQASLAQNFQNVIYFSENGDGASTGIDEANALPISAFNSRAANPGDVHVLSGTIVTPIVIDDTKSGIASLPVFIIGNPVNKAYLNPGAADIAITVNPNASYVHIKDIRIGDCSYGVYGFANVTGVQDILIRNVHVENAAASGIHLATGVSNSAVDYAICRNIVVDSCTVDSSGYFGIMSQLNSDDSCKISNCTVKSASTGGGPFWGIYISGFTKEKTSPTWTGSNPYTISLVGLGWDAATDEFQNIEQLAIIDYTSVAVTNKVHFTKGTYGSLSDWEFGQNGRGGDIQIKLPAADASLNTRSVLTSTFIQDGFIVEDCEVSGVVGTEGIGIGTDLLASNVLIKDCDSHDNLGANFQLGYSSGCEIRNCTSENAGTNDYSTWNCGRLMCTLQGNRGTGAASDSYRFQRSEQNMVTATANHAVDAGGFDYVTATMGTIVSSSNTSQGCTKRNLAIVGGLDKMTLSQSSNNVDMSKLKEWLVARLKVSANSAGAKILCIGDSTTAGAGSTSSIGGHGGGYPYRLATLLNASGIPAKANSFVGFGNFSKTDYVSEIDNRFTFGAGWVSGPATTRQVMGGADLYNNSDTSQTDFAIAEDFDRIDIYYFGEATGSFTVAVDGGATLATVNCSLVATSDLAKTTVNCTLGSHTINIARVNGTVDIAGIVAYNNTVKEVQVLNAGISGSTVGSGTAATGWTFTNSGGPYGWDRTKTGANSTWALWNPDLTIIGLNINDAQAATSLASYKTSLNAIVAAAKTAGDVIMLVCNPFDTAIQTSDFQQTYWDTVKLVASENSCLCIDIPSRWGSSAYNVAPTSGLYTTVVHPNNAGYADIAHILAGILLA